MKTLITLILITLFITGCNKFDIEKGTPKCVVKRIKKNPGFDCGEKGKVNEYLFQGKTVFVFESENYNCGADLGVDVIDSDCNSVGYLGGISGNTKINGEEFKNATFVKTVYQK